MKPVKVLSLFLGCGTPVRIVEVVNFSVLFFCLIKGPFGETVLSAAKNTPNPPLICLILSSQETSFHKPVFMLQKRDTLTGM